MGLFSNMTKKFTEEWANNLTLEEIEEYERKGVDMSEYRVIYEENQAERQRLINLLDLNLLNKYKTAHDPDFMEEVAKFNKLSNKKKQKLEQATLVYAKVVQAHSALFRSNPKNKDGAGIVFLFTLDNTHRYDEEWLTKTANLISDMKARVEQNEPKGFFYTLCRFLQIENNFFISSHIWKQKLKVVPEDCRSFMSCLCNDESSFCMKLGNTLSEGVDVWCGTYSLWDQSQLPMAQIPPNRIIPLLLIGNPEKYGRMDAEAQLIPPAYYTK